MICPICRIEMIAVERSGIELDSCISCRGLWFDHGELDLLAELTGADLSVLDTGGTDATRTRRRCPRCNRPLEELSFGSVRIDRCPERDGLWFDRGELGAILDRALAAAGPLAPMTRFLGEVFGAREEAPHDAVRREPSP
ncbi:MAG TPA: zf-TFIIB domain-containing protein [Thermoanaerobaculia bacterium]|nr:zf-TFIIB domain-containing protein [Thermoanaerobaculia bacterium]